MFNHIRNVSKSIYHPPNILLSSLFLCYCCFMFIFVRASLVAQTVKYPPAMRETWVRSQSQEDPLAMGMAAHSGILAWRIPMDRGAWQATAHGGVTKSWTHLSNWAQHFCLSGRDDSKAETPVLWPPHAKSWLTGKDWCWEGLGAGGEGDERGWDGWMASVTRWTWVWVNSGSCWWTGRPGVLRFMGSQRVGHDWATELNCFLINVVSVFGGGLGDMAQGKIRKLGARRLDIAASYDSCIKTWLSKPEWWC